MTEAELARRLAVLEARRGGPQAPALLDGVDVTAIGDLALDVLEAITREWPSEHLPAGLCAGVAAACDRPAAERSTAVAMVLGRYWPVDEGDPVQVMAGLARCGLLQGTAGDQAGGCR